MKSVARSLGPGFKSDVTMISITTDPKEDGARELLAYAKAQGVDADGWVFLTGSPTRQSAAFWTYTEYRLKTTIRITFWSCFCSAPTVLACAAITASQLIPKRSRRISEKLPRLISSTPVISDRMPGSEENFAAVIDPGLARSTVPRP